jgi:D-psicose/D-tagatose/L-ribulose 3-epimerase
VASVDESVRRNGVEFLQRQARMMKQMGGKQLGGIIYGSWPGKLPAGIVDKRPFVDRSMQSMKEVMKLVEDAGAFFNLEVVNRFEQYLLNTAAEAVEYVKRVGSDHCRVLLDSFHMNIEEDNIRDAVVSTGKYLGHLHIGETNRRAPGRGRMAWDELFGAIKEIDYRGAITMEPFLMPGGEVGRDISVYRDLKGDLDLDEEARRACEFVRSKLK